MIQHPYLLRPGIITAEESLESEVEEPPRFGGISGERILEDARGFLYPSPVSLISTSDTSDFLGTSINYVSTLVGWGLANF